MQPRHRRGLSAVVRWLGVRLLFLVTTLLAASVVVWLLTYALSGDPATAILGATATPERVAALRAELGLDRPLPVQYREWLAGILAGDFGTSAASGVAVEDELWPRLRNSAVVAGGASAIAVGFGIPLGVAAAYRRAWIALAATAVAAVPDFVLGSFVVWLLAIRAGWLPSLSMVPRGAVPWQRPEVLVIPVLVMALVLTGWCVRTVRAVVMTQLDCPSAVVARIQGMPESQVLREHILPRALAPVVQFLGWLAGGAVAAAMVVEQLVGYPGIGSMLVDAVTARDLPVVAGVAVLLAAIVAGTVSLCDVVGALLDPQLRPWRVGA